jgi:hypothetical protein
MPRRHFMLPTRLMAGFLAALAFTAVALVAAPAAQAVTNPPYHRHVVRISNSDGRLETFNTDANGETWHHWNTPDGSRTPDYSLGGDAISGSPGLTKDASGKVHAFVVGTDHAVWVNWQRTASNRTSYGTTWTKMGGYLTSNVYAITNANSKMEIFARGGNGALYTKYQTATGPWSAWTSLGGNITSFPSAEAQADGGVKVIAFGTDGELYSIERPGAGCCWGTWQQ